MNKTLNKNIWNDDNTLKKEIRLNLLQIAKNFYDDIDIDKLKLKDIVFVGSLANYNYNDKSDIDLHLIVDFSDLKEKEIIKNLIQTKKTIWNIQHDIKIKGYEVEVYVEDVEDKQKSTGKFSIIKNEWVIEPSVSNVKEVNIDNIKNKAKLYKETIDFFIKEFKKENSDKEELLKKVDDFRKKISEKRKEAIKTGGEYSVGNLIFKYLRNTNYLEKLLKLRTELYDDIYTIKENSVIRL